MILLTLTLGSRNYFLPESPILQMIACCTRRFRRYPSIFSRDPCAHRLCNSLSPTYPCGYLHALVILLIIPHRSCCYKMPRDILCCPENPLSLLSCGFISHENPYRFSSSYLSRSFLNCAGVSQWSSKYYSILQKSLVAYCSAILVCLHYGGSHITSNIH